MDFAVPDVNAVGPSDPALLAARGSDPLLLVPNTHLFTRIRNVTLQTSPGSLVPDSVNYSLLETLAASCIYIDPATSGAAYKQSFLTHLILPTKLDAALTQLLQEPSAGQTGLYPDRVFDSLTEAVAAVRLAVNSLDTNHLSPVYRLTQADVYRVEPVPNNGHQLMRNLGGSNDTLSLTYGSMVRNGKGFFHHGALLGYTTMGRSRTATRDAPGGPSRAVFEIVNEFVISAGLTRTGTLLTPALLLGWLEITEPPGFLQILEEHGTALDRREQTLRTRHQLSFGTDDQKELVISRMITRRPLADSLPNLNKVLGDGDHPPSEVRLSLHRLVRDVLQKSASNVVVKDLSLIHSLERELTPLVHCLTAPALMGATLEKKVSAVAEMKHRVGPGIGGAPYLTEGKGDNSSSLASSVAKIRATHFSDDLAQAMNSAEWRATETSLEAALLDSPVNLLRVHYLLIQSPVLGVRKLALGHTDASVAGVLAHSKVLLRALSEVESKWKFIASQFLVCDLGTMTVNSPDLMSFKLSDRVANALRRGAFNEIDWVKDILCEVQKVENPNLELDEYPQGLYDPRVFLLLDPLLKRVARLLGLPLSASSTSRAGSSSAIPPAPLEAAN